MPADPEALAQRQVERALSKIDRAAQMRVLQHVLGKVQYGALPCTQSTSISNSIGSLEEVKSLQTIPDFMRGREP